MGADRPPAGRADPMAILVADVERLLAEATTRLGIDTGPLLARFRAPLTVAVAGRTNAGKSTLVNALIGHRIAPTRATECTRVVTWFRYGAQEAAWVVCRREPGAPTDTDRLVRPLWLTADQTLPDELGVPVDQVDRVEVRRSYEPLERVEVIDTPGLFGDEGLAAHTEQLLADEAADVLLFVCGRTLTDYEVQVLTTFRKNGTRLYDFPGNVLGVLNRADLHGADGDRRRRGDHDYVWAAATECAAAHARVLADQVSGVCPVIGKIAESTESGGFGARHADWLRTLARVDPERRVDALFDADEFAELDCEVPIPDRRTLVDRLGMHGIRVLSGSIDQHTSAAAMHDHLRAMSGIAALRARIVTMFLRPAAVHKTVRALADLSAIAATSPFTATDRAWLDDAVGALRRSPPMHTLAELRALAALFSGRCVLPEPMRQNAVRMLSGTDPVARLGVSADSASALAETALEAANWWTRVSNSATDPQVRMLADTAAWSAELIYDAWRQR
ncbi:GTPase [Rhodococcus koreensis]|uniref:GTPase n=1 Tax=Rhodococcus koreensis TaxID=99653 RepID=UPI0036DD4A5F